MGQVAEGQDTGREGGRNLLGGQEGEERGKRKGDSMSVPQDLPSPSGGI